MPSRPKFGERIPTRPATDERSIFRVQLAVFLVVITLLDLGFYHGRELQDLEARQNLQRVIHGWDGLVWYVWLAAAPAMLFLIRRYPLTRDRTGPNLFRLGLGSVGIYFLVANVRYALRVLPYSLLPGHRGLHLDWTIYWHTETVLMPLDFLTYCGFFGISFAIDYYFKNRQRAEEIVQLQLEAVRLQSELTQSQLAILRGQLHPHFLCNAFNAISTLVRQHRNELAADMIARLSAMLRLTMQNVDQPELTLDQEIDFVTSYLELERVRFSDKLRTEIAVVPSVRRCVVPSLLLQPLVENAIKHGISRRVTPGCVRLTGARHGDRILLEVIDDGPDAEAGEEPRPPAGIGLRNTRRRLGHAYGDDFRLEIARRPEGGTIVTLDLPWREAPSPAATPRPEPLVA